MENLNKTQKLIFIIIATFMLLVIGYYFMHKTKQYDSYEITEMVQEDKNSEDSNNNLKEELPNTIVVHITGAVEEEGIVFVVEGSRIIDVITKAGGTRVDAELSNVNLAYMVKDGQKIYIPSIHDEEIQKEIIDNSSGENIIIDGDILESGGMVNINKANQTELETLSGIGPSTALKIIEYRKQNGEFKNIEDVMNVPGIGESKFELIKDDICI